MTPKELVAQVQASLEASIPALGVCCTRCATPGMLLLSANLTGGIRFKCNDQATLQVRFKPGQEELARNQLLKLIHLGVSPSDQQRSHYNRSAARASQQRLGNAKLA